MQTQYKSYRFNDALYRRLLLLLLLMQDTSIVTSLLRAARAGNQQQTVDSLDAGADVNVRNAVSTYSSSTVHLSGPAKAVGSPVCVSEL